MEGTKPGWCELRGSRKEICCVSFYLGMFEKERKELGKEKGQRET